MTIPENFTGRGRDWSKLVHAADPRDVYNMMNAPLEVHTLTILCGTGFMTMLSWTCAEPLTCMACVALMRDWDAVA